MFLRLVTALSESLSKIQRLSSSKDWVKYLTDSSIGKA